MTADAILIGTKYYGIIKKSGVEIWRSRLPHSGKGAAIGQAKWYLGHMSKSLAEKQASHAK